MKIAKALSDLIDSFQSLPGIGPKSAQRLSYYLLHVPESQLEDFSESLLNLKKNTVLCAVCKNVSETDPCDVCSSSNRDIETILVVEEPLDALAFEKTGRFRGLYHILHGKISPLENIGPDEIFIGELIERIKKGGTKEVIIATNPTMEGEATAMYITKEIKKIDGDIVKITRLGMGIPTGADLEYADEATLTQAIEGRREV
jgi:recombination protein RecR